MAFRITLLGGLAAVLLAILVFRLWALQIISGDEYLSDALNNQVRTARVDGPRGTILDVRGRVLVRNKPGTIVRFWPGDVLEDRRSGMLRRLSRLLDVPVRDIEAEIDRVEGDPLSPAIVRAFVPEVQADFLLEHQDEFPGVEVVETELREYPFGSLASHILGYVGEISREELERLDPDTYEPGDRIGKTGIEFRYDQFLRGDTGTEEVRVDALGQIVRTRRETEKPVPGNAIRLTIDAGVQRAAEDALRRGIARVRFEDNQLLANGGAVVAIDPRNGAIRAIASNPDFDPAIWVGRRDPDDIARLGSRFENSPGLNRAIEGLYPPGSAFKPVTALAALSERNATGTAPLLTTDELVQCPPFMLVRDRVFRNWQERNTAMTLERALAESCDTYFYNLGLRFFNLPPERGSPLQFWARRMGFGEFTGIDVGPESDGLLPTPEWRRRTGTTAVDKIWKPGDSVLLSIGQGFLLVTPLQMARFYAMLANGGRLVEPHLVRQVEQPGSEPGDPTVLRAFAPLEPHDIGLDPHAISVVRDGLFKATHEDYGTSTSTFRDYAIPIAGKTGTAEKFVELPKGALGLEQTYVGNQDQAWWCGYGPATAEDEAELAVCVVIENGGLGGRAAAPVALEVFEAYFGERAAEQPGTGDVRGLTD
ncbi:MAG: penicillin-binding protein 2 [Actinomycetia bacterium]|nr:penicillin-binding protein 2 [Actinomycetes bacterium]